jgi:hypothetical protein
MSFGMGYGGVDKRSDWFYYAMNTLSTVTKRTTITVVLRPNARYDRIRFKISQSEEDPYENRNEEDITVKDFCHYPDAQKDFDCLIDNIYLKLTQPADNKPAR